MKTDIKAKRIANKIRMTRSQHEGTFLLVEGSTDARFYKRFIDIAYCQIIPANNKENAIETLNILEQDDFPGILTIVDADFWHLEGYQPSSNNLLLTDTHDIETMMLESPTLEKVLEQWGSLEKLEKLAQKQDVRSMLLNNGQLIGYLRWVSQKDKLSLKFEGIDFSRFLDKKTLELNLDKLIQEVKNKSKAPQLDIERLKQAINPITNPQHNLWDVCCGHDLIEILSFGLRNILGSNRVADIRPEQLEKIVRAAYEFSYFCLTRLYNSIQIWENQNSPFRVLTQ